MSKTANKGILSSTCSSSLGVTPTKDPESQRFVLGVSLVGGPGLSQRPVIWHGGEERVPELTVDEKHNEQHQQEEQ